jgi:hypothetical protein
MGKFMTVTSIASQSLAPDAITKASSQNKAFFVVYMVLLLGAAVLTYLLWRSGNKVQDAIVADANARIGEARQKASEANAEAGRANQRAGELEYNNLTLRGQVATLENSVVESKKSLAELQIEAANAKANQQKVELQLALAQQNAAEANRKADEEHVMRLKLQRSLAPRVIPEIGDINGTSYDSLKPFAQATPLISYVPDEEAHQLALNIAAILRLAGWNVANPTSYEAGGYYGVYIYPSLDDKNKLAYRASDAITVFLGGCYIRATLMPALQTAPNELMPVVDDKTLRIVVGLKPFPEITTEKADKEMPRGNPIDRPCVSPAG